MKREQWKDLIEIVTAFAIIVSLVFVGLEIRQNTNAVRSTVAQSISEQSYDAIVLMIENGELRAALSAIEGESPDEKKRLLFLYYGALVRIQLNRYTQIQLGVIDAKTVFAMGGSGGIYDRASFRDYWSLARNSHSPEFVSYMEDLVFSKEPGTF